MRARQLPYLASLAGAILLAACGPEPTSVQAPPPAPPPPAPVKPAPPKSDSDIAAAIEGLKYPDAMVRKDASLILIAKGEAAVEPLIKALFGTAIETVKVEIITILGRIGDPGAISHLATALGDENESVGIAASGALEEFGTSTVETVIKVLEHGTPQGRTQAAALLGKFEDPRAIQPLIDAMWHTDKAAEVIHVFGKAAQPGLLVALEKGDVKSKAGAAAALGKINVQAAIGPLIGALNEWDPGVQKAAAKALGDLGASKAVTRLEELLDHHDPLVRAAVVEAIGKIGGAVDPQPIIDLLKDDHQHVQQNAIFALGELGIPAAVDQLVALLAEDDKWVPYLASEALAKIGDPAVDALAEVTLSGNPQVKSLAAASLGNIGGKDSARALVALLSDEDVSADAVTALIEVGPPAVKPLVKALSSKKAGVPHAAVEALRGITGEDLGNNPKAWKNLEY
ncbi:MAG: HEAT repeat domain-containing protein [Deltaproteobacteria bacterium]|nr:HEAT repeat domain-containing protein [Deltaproteobacteria bacterium]